MELASFITSHREAILAEWEKEARDRVTGHGISVAQLRDHLGELLDTVAKELLTPEVPTDRDVDGSSRESVEAVAEKHGARRAQQGMTIDEVLSEFPMLRSCVERLWIQSQPETTPAGFESIRRFDEAIDRALKESAGEFMDQLDQSRSTLIGILSHDLRDPLGTIITGGKLVLEEKLDATKTRDIVGRMVATGERLHHLVLDLLDATRTRFGGEMPIERREADLGETVRNIADEFTTAHPDRAVKLTVAGDPRGQWDDKRLGQAVGNLVGNALRYGKAETPIDIAAGDEVRIAVHNEGPVIPKERLASLFEPFRRMSPEQTARRDREHVGLGLYIAKEIVAAHSGRIEVESSPERGTTFTIRLPRQADGTADAGEPTARER
jgi:signal transduction histidine kinase